MSLNLKPSHKIVTAYYAALEAFKQHRVTHETAVRSAFQNLLDSCGRQLGWTLVPEFAFKKNGRNLRIDGALIDGFTIARAYWEAKDERDDISKEIQKKKSIGYPFDNIIFQSPERAVLFQNGREVFDADLTDAEQLVRVVEMLFDYNAPQLEDWEKCVVDFQGRISEYGTALIKLIESERKSNNRFATAFAAFVELCRQSINPNLSENAVEEMLIQHLLTERIFRTVFRNNDFARRNVIALEIEKVIDALTSQSFSREQFLSRFDYFYRALEKTADTIEDFAQKQTFLNTVYEQFFQGFSVKVADTHGIVYTPQPIVDFMVRSVDEILKESFGKSLSSENVHILDPFVGTGNFIVRVMQEIKRTALEQKYKSELHCNEVMLLPYYIASMNIEHEFYELSTKYAPFEGICLVDTFELSEHAQAGFEFMTAENTLRVKRQKESPIFVVIGNPPYNVGQLNENDNNKNRKYKAMDKRVAETYAADSKATLKNKLSDVYVKAIRWASDKIKQNGSGVVAFVTNNSFVDKLAFDGMRKQLQEDFDQLYILDLGGDVRKNPKLSGTTNNVFGIQVGVSINFLIKRKADENKLQPQIHYSRLDEFWNKSQKYDFLNEHKHIQNVQWQEITPDAKHNWLTEGMNSDFETFIATGNKESKNSKSLEVEAIFKTYSLGVSTNRDVWALNFDRNALESNIKQMIDFYNEQVFKWLHSDKQTSIDDFVIYDEKRVSWSDTLKRNLKNGKPVSFSPTKLRASSYRPFSKKFLYFERVMSDRLGGMPQIFPTVESESENQVICVSGVGSSKLFHTEIVSTIPCLDFLEKTQCFPFYIYDEDGTNRRENITDWCLNSFCQHYENEEITKQNIFHYVYAMLHHDGYRQKYAANLKRELPRIPFAPNFETFANAGQKLAALHTDYENAP